MTDAPVLRLVLADDHELVRAGLRLLFSQMGGIEVVGEAASGQELLVLVQRLEPDVVITDLSMPGGDGLSAIDAIKRQFPDLRIIVVSMYDSADYVRRALRSGADAYVLKGAPPFELEHALRAVRLGSGYFSPQVSHRLLQAAEPTPEEVLTQRQVDILVRLARGLSAKEIAFELGLSSKTVDVHRSALMLRLNLHDIASLTLYAVRHHLVDPQDQRTRAAPGSRP